VEVSGDSTNSRHHAGMFLWTDKHLQVLCEEATAVFRGNVPLTRWCILPFVVGPQRLINLILLDLQFSKFINMLGGSAARNASHLYLKVFFCSNLGRSIYCFRGGIRVIVILRSLDSLGGLTSAYRLDGRGSIPNWGKLFSILHSVQTGSGAVPTQPLINGHRELFPRV
jgi:hypothetical protein